MIRPKQRPNLRVAIAPLHYAKLPGGHHGPQEDDAGKKLAISTTDGRINLDDDPSLQDEDLSSSSSSSSTSSSEELRTETEERRRKAK